MEYDSKKIIDAFEDPARDVLLKNTQEWLRTQRTHVQKLQGTLNTIKIDLVHNEEWPANPGKLWTGLRENLSKIRHWISVFRFVPEETSEPEFIKEWKDRFDRQLSEYPEELTILIGDSYWSVQPHDAISVRLLKKFQPFRQVMRLFSNNLANSLRLAVQRPPYRLPARKRNIHLHLFARYFIDLPVREMMISEWQKFLQSIFGQLFLIHEHLKHICKIALIDDESGRLYQEQDDPAKFNELYNLAEILKEIEIALQALENYQQQLTRRLDQQWKDISQNFQIHWDKAGTFQFSNKKYNVKKIENRAYRITNKTKRHISGWQNQWRGLSGQWQKDLDLILLKFRLAEQVDHEYGEFNRHIEKVINPAFRRVIASIEKGAQQITELNGNTDQNKIAVGKAIEILRMLPGSELAQLLEILSHTNPVRLPNKLFIFLKEEIANLNPEYITFIFRDSETIPPRSRTTSVTLKDIISRIYASIWRNYDQFIQQNLGKQEAGLRIVSKLDQMIGYNLQMTDSAIHSPDSENRMPEISNNIEHILHHARHTLTELEQTFTELSTSINNFLIELLEHWEQKLTSLFENSQAYRLQRQIQKSAKRNRISKAIYHVLKALSGSIFAFFKTVSMVFFNFWKTYIIAGPVEGERDPAIEINKEIKRFLSQTEEKISGLPLVYRNLFKFEPLADDRLYAARIAELSQLRETFESWLTGKPQTCAIIGELGSGRTTLLNMAREKLFSKTPVFDVVVSHPPTNQDEFIQLIQKSAGFKNIKTMDDLIGQLNKTTKRCIGIIENVNDLFLRTVSGLSVVETLLDMIHRTSGKIFWIVTGTPYSWQYLQKTVNIDTYFNTMVHLNSFSNGDIESIINARHRMSGFDILFEPNGNIEENRKLRRLRTEEGKQNYLRSRFFNKLNTISAGNITIAMLYWLRAIKEFSNDKLILSVALDFNFEFLSYLSYEELFSIAAIINHEDLTPHEHALIFQQTVEKSRLQLTQMAQSGLLVNKDDSYEVHPFLYRHLVELLKSRKILY